MNRTTFIELLEKRDFKTLKNTLEIMNAVDIALLLSNLEDKERAFAFRLIPKDKAADVFSNMSNPIQSYLVKIFTEKELRELLDNLYMDDTVDLLEELPANLVTRILHTVSSDKRDLINQLLKFPENSAGSIMTTEYVSLKKTMTIKETMKHIKEVGIHKETIYTCYVLENRRLIGIVSAKDLMTLDDNTFIQDIMETEIISVGTHTDQEETARLFSKYDLLALPVVDLDNRMVGIITWNSMLLGLANGAPEDISIMGAVNPSEKTYFETSVFSHAKNRFLWLLILMLSSTITGTIITQYENAFAAIPLLVSFIPMLMDTGGNCGSQSSTLIIRGLALDEIRFKDIFRVIFKEFRVALLVSLGLALANGLRIFIMYKDLKLAVVIGLSLICTVILSKIIGCILPLFAKKINLDPAIMAAPLITTLVDTCSIIIYFTIATHIFQL